jgi:predicted Na+-dependent transporter
VAQNVETNICYVWLRELWIHRFSLIFLIGDVALSVTLTALSIIITVLTIPVLTNLALQHFLGQTAAISLPIGQTMLQIFLITLLPTAIGMGMFRLPLAQQICIAIEVGIQNGTLAIAITAGLLQNFDIAVPAAVYSLLMYVTGFGAILYGRRTTLQES